MCKVSVIRYSVHIKLRYPLRSSPTFTTWFVHFLNSHLLCSLFHTHQTPPSTELLYLSTSSSATVPHTWTALLPGILSLLCKHLKTESAIQSLINFSNNCHWPVIIPESDVVISIMPNHIFPSPTTEWARFLLIQLMYLQPESNYQPSPWEACAQTTSSLKNLDNSWQHTHSIKYYNVTDTYLSCSCCTLLNFAGDHSPSEFSVLIQDMWILTGLDYTWLPDNRLSHNNEK